MNHSVDPEYTVERSLSTERKGGDSQSPQCLII